MSSTATSEPFLGDIQTLRDGGAKVEFAKYADDMHDPLVAHESQPMFEG